MRYIQQDTQDTKGPDDMQGGLGVVPESCIKNCKECLEKWINSYTGGFSNV